MKKKTLLKTMLLLCALVVGSGSAWATDVTYTLTINASDFNTTSYAANNNEKTSNAVCTTDNTKTYEVKWTSNQVMKNGNNMQWKKNDGYIYNSTDLGTINSVTVNSSAGSFTTYYGTEEHPTSGTTVGNGFFTTAVGGATGTTSSIVVSFTISEGGGDTPTLEDCDLALTGAPVALSFDLYNNSSSQTVSYTTSSTGEVSIANNNYATFSIDQANKIITVSPTAVTPNAQTITVHQEADATYAAGSTTFTITITDSTPFAGGDITFNAGTDLGSTSSNYSADEVSKSVVTISSTDAAFATAQYRLYSGSTTTISTSQGTITKIVFTKNGNYDLSNLSTETGTYTSSTGTWEGNATSVEFSAAAQVRLDKIVVTVETTTKNEPNLSFGETTTFTVNPNASFTAPTLTYATGFDGTIVYSSNNEDVALVDENTGDIVIGSVEGTATITAASAATANYYAGSASYTINVVDSREDAGLAWSADKVNIDLDATSYTLPTLTNDNDLTVSYSSNNESVAVIDASTGETIVETSAVGTATITATFAGDANYKPATASYIIKIIDPNANDGSLEKPYTVADIIGGVENTSGVYVKGFIVGSWNNSQFDLENLVNTNLALADTPDETNGSYTIPVELKSAFRPDFGLVGDGDNPSRAYNIGVAQVLIKGNAKTYFSTNGVKELSSIEKLAEQVSVSNVGVATYSTDVDLDFTGTDITAYTAETNGTTVNLTAIEGGVPANTGVILKANGGASVLIPVATTTATLENNELVANVSRAQVAENGEGGKTNYILSNEEAGIGFYKAATGTGAYLPAHRAYLSTTNSANARFLAFDFDSETTGISSTLKEEKNNAIYNLNGQRVSQPQKGLFIKDGKKIIVK